MNNFSKSQKEAISFNKGAAMIVAGPGSGKTTVITHRIYNLIFKYKVTPENILVVTFTKAAATNMSLRFKALVAGRTYPVFFGTFHSIFYRILRLEKDYPSDGIISEYVKYNIVKEIVVRLKLRVPSVDDFVGNIISEIGKVKGNNIDVSTYQPRICRRDVFAKVYEEYESAKRYEKKIDFEDMLLDCYKLLKENDAVRTKWQDIFKYILVDEFQDINKIQYDIVRLLLGEENNLFVVGDDDQAIYGFRGSRPEIMVDLEKDFPDITKIFLNRNYRSTPQIVDSATKLINSNNVRIHKDIFSRNEPGDTPDIRMFKSPADEIRYTCKMVKKYLASGVKAEDIAVLVRNNSYIKNISKALEESGLNASSKSKVNPLYTNDIAEDISHYIKAASRWKEVKLYMNEDAISILNVPDRGLSKRMIISDEMGIGDVVRMYAHNKSIAEEIKKLDFNMKMIATLNPYGAINYIMNVIGYEAYLRKTVDSPQKLQHKLGTLNRLYNDATRFDTAEEWIDYYDMQKGSGRCGVLASDASKSNSASNTANLTNAKNINVMTMHSAKGLEFEVVFVLHANQGIIPGSRACRERDFQEERRLFYVAMTRAIRHLHIFYSREFSGYHLEPSMFIGDIM